MVYEAEGGLVSMKSRLRITPYFSLDGASQGELIAIKATACPNTTNYIHASTESINTTVS